FAPTAIGPATGTITTADDAAGNPHTISLTGTGLSPLVGLSAASLDFGAQIVGTKTPKSVTVTNTGNAALAITGIAASGDFTQTNTCGTSVAGGANCTIAVTFAPTAGGARSGTLTIADNAPGSPQTVAISGAGQDFSLAAASSSSTSAKVTAGATASYNLNIAPG